MFKHLLNLFFKYNVFVELVIYNSITASLDVFRFILRLWCVECINSNIIEKWFRSLLFLFLNVFLAAFWVWVPVG
jgi:hypothetical protein